MREARAVSAPSARARPRRFLRASRAARGSFRLVSSSRTTWLFGPRAAQTALNPCPEAVAAGIPGAFAARLIAVRCAAGGSAAVRAVPSLMSAHVPPVGPLTRTMRAATASPTTRRSVESRADLEDTHLSHVRLAGTGARDALVRNQRKVQRRCRNTQYPPCAVGMFEHLSAQFPRAEAQRPISKPRQRAAPSRPGWAEQV